jgi:hypothetical protein
VTQCMVGKFRGGIGIVSSTTGTDSSTTAMVNTTAGTGSAVAETSSYVR